MREIIELEELLRRYEALTGGRESIQSDKHRAIENFSPHYTQPRFRQPQTVFLATGYKTVTRGGTSIVLEATYQYSDRLYQWDYKKSNESWDAVAATDTPLRSAAFIEMYLQLYFDAPELNLVHILSSFNQMNGFPYQVFGYVLPKPAAIEASTQE